MMTDGWAGAQFWAHAEDAEITLDYILDNCEVVVVSLDGGGLDDLYGGSVLGRLYGERVAAPRRAVLAEAITRGVERGELPPSVDVELLVDVLVGTLLLRRIQGGLAGSPPGLAESVVDLLLAGLLAGQHVAQE